MSGLAYLATGFAVVWFFLACYLYWIGHKQRALLAKLKRLEEALKHRPDID
jgi:CcmD family protein